MKAASQSFAYFDQVDLEDIGSKQVVLSNPAYLPMLAASSAEVSLDSKVFITMYTSYTVRISMKRREGVMTSVLHYELRDLPTMIGLASFTGAAANIGFNLATGSTAPQILAMAFALGGFVGGKLLSDKLRRPNHG
jgi:UDP-N-acetylmuramyl pentapeptide phosphotransferase/UDP-N-acetylglucosamine-1-phosphate transferase